MIKQRQSLTHSCYDRLKKAILDGEHLPGESLKIHELKLQYAAGGSPIREALARLVTHGLVTNEGKTGFKVAPVSVDAMRDVYQTFYQLENTALTQAIALGDDHWEAKIIATLHPLTKIENQKPIDYLQWRTYNDAFHLALIAGCNSPTLLHVRQQTHLLLERYLRLSFFESDINPAEHTELAECVMHRQTVKACGLMKHHILGGLDEAIDRLSTRFATSINGIV